MRLSLKTGPFSSGNTWCKVTCCSWISVLTWELTSIVWLANFYQGFTVISKILIINTITKQTLVSVKQVAALKIPLAFPHHIRPKFKPLSASGFQRKPQHRSWRQSDAEQHFFRDIFLTRSERDGCWNENFKKYLVWKTKSEKNKSRAQNRCKAEASNVQESCWINVTGVFHLASCWKSARTFPKVSDYDFPQTFVIRTRRTSGSDRLLQATQKWISISSSPLSFVC